MLQLLLISTLILQLRSCFSNPWFHALHKVDSTWFVGRMVGAEVSKQINYILLVHYHVTLSSYC